MRETDTCRIELVDGVLVFSYYDGAIVGIEQARLTVRTAKELVDRQVPWLIRTGKTKKMSPEARKYLGEGSDIAAICSATAILVGSPVTRIMGSFFLGLSRPRFPLRLFDIEANALAWLETFKRAQEAQESGDDG